MQQENREIQAEKIASRECFSGEDSKAQPCEGGICTSKLL